MDYWRSGRLPDNDQVLSQITKLSPDAWSNAKAMLVQFFSIENGYWVHKRVEQEMLLAKENKVKNTSRAKLAADARWKKQQDNAKSNATSNARSNATSNTKAMLEECPSPSPSPSENKTIYTDSFERFWSAYPSKVGKGGAFKSWQKLKPSIDLQAKMLEAIEAQKKSKKWLDGFIKNPQTWINERCWEDEVATSAKSTVDNSMFKGLANVRS
jgi:uncharacterized protein YdaU (DUF1376 family)